MSVAISTKHTKMAAQLRAADKGPLHRLRGVKVVFSYPPSMYAPLKLLIDQVRRSTGGDGVFGIHDELRLAVRNRGEEGSGSKDEIDLSESEAEAEAAGSPTKVTWLGPEVSWCHLLLCGAALDSVIT